jgi:hypothetical protein
VALTICLSLPFVSCGEESTSFKVEDSAFDQMEQRGSELRIRLRDGVPLADAVDLSSFGDFASDRPLWSIVERSGASPDRESPARTSWRFARTDGYLEIQRISVSSDGPAAEKWELWYFPASPRAPTTLQPSLARLGNILAGEMTDVSVIEARADGNLTLKLKSGLVHAEYLAFPGRDHFRQRKE